MHGDGAQRAEARLFIGDVSWYRSGQVFRHCVNARMVGDAGAGHGDAFANPESTFQSGAYGDHFAGRRITQR